MTRQRLARHVEQDSALYVCRRSSAELMEQVQQAGMKGLRVMNMLGDKIRGLRAGSGHESKFIQHPKLQILKAELYHPEQLGPNLNHRKQSGFSMGWALRCLSWRAAQERAINCLNLLGKS